MKLYFSKHPAASHIPHADDAVLPTEGATDVSGRQRERVLHFLRRRGGTHTWLQAATAEPCGFHDTDIPASPHSLSIMTSSHAPARYLCHDGWAEMGLGQQNGASLAKGANRTNDDALKYVHIVIVADAGYIRSAR